MPNKVKTSGSWSKENPPKKTRKGSPNKFTAVNRAFWEAILERQSENIESALNDLFQSSKDAYMRHVLAANEFTTPKLARTENVNMNFDSLDFKNLTDKELLEIRQKLDK